MRQRQDKGSKANAIERLTDTQTHKQIGLERGEYGFSRVSASSEVFEAQMDQASLRMCDGTRQENV